VTEATLAAAASRVVGAEIGLASTSGSQLREAGPIHRSRRFDRAVDAPGGGRR
jgi:hypothetical protein